MAQRVAALVPAATVLDRDLDTSTRWIKEAGSTYSERGTTILEAGQGQLHAKPHVQLISCHVTSIKTRTGRTEQPSSDEGLWQRPKRQGKKGFF